MATQDNAISDVAAKMGEQAAKQGMAAVNSMKNYDAFLEAVGARESSGDYKIVNSIGFLGKYQMGEAALIDSDYYKKDGTAKNDWKDEWTGKDGVNSKADFLDSPKAQENAIRTYMDVQWKYITNMGLDKAVGKTLSDGTTLTQSGMLAGAHLVGIGGLRDYIKSDGQTVPKDGNGTKISEYVKEFAGYETPHKGRNQQVENTLPDKLQNLKSSLETNLHDKLAAAGCSERVAESMIAATVNQCAKKEIFDVNFAGLHIEKNLIVVQGSRQHDTVTVDALAASKQDPEKMYAEAVQVTQHGAPQPEQAQQQMQTPHR